MWGNSAEVRDLLGKTLESVVDSGNLVTFTTVQGEVYEMYHEQDCCESVSLESVDGHLEDLVGTPIVMAEAVVGADREPLRASDAEYGSYTWTFYKFATSKGYVTLRWYGTSNGYYSERVGFYKKEM